MAVRRHRPSSRSACHRYDGAMRAVGDRRRAPDAGSLGWHPWFRKPEQLEFHPESMYRRDDDHIAVDELVDIPRTMGRLLRQLVAGARSRSAGSTLRLESDCRDWVVYDMPSHATCVEPQSAPPERSTSAQPPRARRSSCTACLSINGVRYRPVTEAR